MAVSYIAPTVQGNGDGTSAANAWAFSSLASAESQAGAGGTIYFVDGSYAFSGNKTFAGANNLTYESLNLHGAVLGDTGYVRRLVIGSGTIDGIQINKFRMVDVQDFEQYGAEQANNKMDQCLITTTVANNLHITSVFYCGSGFLEVTNTVIEPFIITSGFRFFSAADKLTFQFCTFNIKTSGTLSTKIQWHSTSPQSGFLKNTIFVCDNAANIKTDTYGDFAQFSTDCSFFQMGTANDSGGTRNLYNTDPLFLDPTSAKFQLRPNSPCIGGGAISHQSRLEAAHPTGKWFDSNAAGGGDGSYATPYDVIEDAINSFTTALAVVFVKEGDHVLKTGFNGVTSAVDFTQAHTTGIKIIGESKKSRFLTGTSLSSWAMWAVIDIGAPYSPPNSMLSPMFFENIVVLFNEVGASVARGWLCAKFITMTNCIIDQVDGAFITGNLFYSSPNPDIVLTDCIVAASMCKATQVQLIPSGSTITAERCTFADLGRAVITLRPSQFIYYNNISGSTFTDCLFYSSVLMDDNPGFFNTTTQITTIQFTRCSVFNNASIAGFSDFVSQLAEEYRIDCVLTDPLLTNAVVTGANLHLRPSSPCIGAAGPPAPVASASYIAPTAQGDGDGTSAANAWGYSSLASAEAQAGAGGTVYFTDGIYSLTAASWEVDDLTYASLNSEGAVIDGTVAAQNDAIRVLTQGDYSNSVGVTVQGFKFIDFKIFHEQDNGTSAINEVKSCNFVNSTYLDYGGLGIMQGNWSTSVVKLTHCSMSCLIYSGTKLFYDANVWQIRNCSFAICFHASAGTAAGGMIASTIKTDSVFYSNDASKVTGISVTSGSTRCCWYNWGSSTSGGTNNIFLDPQFLNPTTNLQLRPKSPLLGQSI